MAVAHDLRVDGEPASFADLTHQALFNYGAYTSFRVEAGGVRGLDLHLARLEASAVELFGEPVGEARLRALMRDAVGAGEQCWLRVSLFSPELSMREPTWRGRPKVMIGAFDPPPPLADGVRLQLQTYAREAAYLKHAATFGLMRARRTAREAGFDDALFEDEQGWVSEGSLWNIGFIAGEDVVWPRAPMLAGVARALLQTGMERVGLSQWDEPVHASDLAKFDGAFLCNSATPACAVAAIGERSLATSPILIDRLRAAWASNPVQPI